MYSFGWIDGLTRLMFENAERLAEAMAHFVEFCIELLPAEQVVAAHQDAPIPAGAFRSTPAKSLKPP